MNLDPIWVLEGVIAVIVLVIILVVEHGHPRKRRMKRK